MDHERARVLGYRSLAVVVSIVLVVVVVWTLVTPATRIPQRIAVEAAPDVDWALATGTDPDERDGVAGVPVLGHLVDPGRGEWTWHVTGPRDDLLDAVVSWLLQDPAPDPATEAAGVAEVGPTRGLEGRSWEGRLADGGTSTLTGVSATALRSVTVTVVVQPVMLVEDFTEVTVRVD